MTLSLDPSSLRDNPDLVARNPDLFAEPAEKPSKPRKYRNTPTEYGGRYYQSCREAARARDLDLMRKAGEIIAWFPQVSFPLEKGIRYVCDFLVLLPDLTVRVEDAKGVRTKEYRIKKKLFEVRYPGHKIVEI